MLQFVQLIRILAKLVEMPVNPNMALSATSFSLEALLRRVRAGEVCSGHCACEARRDIDCSAATQCASRPLFVNIWQTALVLYVNLPYLVSVYHFVSDECSARVLNSFLRWRHFGPHVSRRRRFYALAPVIS